MFVKNVRHMYLDHQMYQGPVLVATVETAKGKMKNIKFLLDAGEQLKRELTRVLESQSKEPTDDHY